MKYLKKVLKLLGFILIITLASIGVGINGAIFPTFHRQDSHSPTIEMVESKDEESEIEEKEQKK